MKSLENVLSVTKWWNRHTSLTRISRRSYYRNTNGIPKQVSRVHQVFCRQESFNHDLSRTMWWSNQDQNCSWSNLRSGLWCQKAFSFIKQICTVCFGGYDGNLSYGFYKQVVAIKWLNTYSNNEPQTPHGYKGQVKIKYKATKAIDGKFPNRTTALMELLSNALVPLDWDGYFALP